MDRAITRRDFVQGIAVGAAGALTAALPAWASDSAPETSSAAELPGHYPPRLTGLRGSHPGSFEVAHACRDGAPPGPVTDSGEQYDLVVVGAGISGLSAAH